MNSEEIFKLDKKYMLNTYNRKRLVLNKGRGLCLWDVRGKTYLDFFSGVAVNNLGHCHPEIVKAIKKQLDKLIHVSNIYYSLPQIELAKMLCDLSFADKAFFCNSGAEANEAAIKLARKYAKKKLGAGKFEIITMLDSFHGRTMGSLTATGQKKYREGFEPLLPGFKYVPFNDIKALQKVISKNCCAVMLELIQGEGGVNIASREYIKKVRQICNKNNLLFIIDEVQTGIGRTGEMFAYQYFGVKPDIMTLAKALGGGLPIGALLTTDKIAAFLQPGEHASTFGGNLLVCSAAIAVLKTIKKENVLKNSNVMGEYFVEELKKLKQEFACIKDIRAKGLMIGIELDFNGEKMVDKFLEQGVIINCTQGNVLRIMPPLTINKKEINLFLNIFKKLFEDIKK